MRGTIAACMVGLVVLTATFFSANVSADVGVPTSEVLTLRGPISIDGNAGFTAENGVTGGTGEPWDPYIIEGWEIVDSYIAIRIANTDKWFEIRNVYLHGGTGGVYFYAVSNGTVINSDMEGFAHAGIAVWSGTNIVIGESVTAGNGHEGIIFRDSVSLNISGNIVSSNAWQGIMLERCQMSWVIRNVISDNVFDDASDIYAYQAGVTLFSCADVSVYHNSIIEDPGQHAYDDVAGANIWDVGYPMGGNHWSDYGGEDIMCGPEQSLPGSDGLGDSPRFIVNSGVDRYPVVDSLTFDSAPYACFFTNVSASEDSAFVCVDASWSRDNEDHPSILQVRWDFEDDGVWDTPLTLEKTAEHEYTISGIYTIRLQVMDSTGATGETVRVVSVDASPPVAVAGSDIMALVGQNVMLDGSASYDDVGIAQFVWSFWDCDFVILEGAMVYHTFLFVGTYDVTLTVCDACGRTSTDALVVTVTGQTVTLTKLSGKADASTVYWLFEPVDNGEWCLRMDNYGLRSVVIEIYDATYGPAYLVFSATVKMSLYEAYPLGTAISDSVTMYVGAEYIIKVTPQGSVGAFALVNDMFDGES